MPMCWRPGIGCCLRLTTQGTPSVAATISVGLGGEDFSPGFQGYVTESGAATYDGASDVFTLTPNAAGKVGAVMSNDRIDLTQNFTLTFSAFLGSKDAGGSGIAFVLHSDPSGGDAFGGGANAQGANGIANGLAISLDTFKDRGRRKRPIIQTSSIQMMPPALLSPARHRCRTSKTRSGTM